jgi:hypothetical protein
MKKALVLKFMSEPNPHAAAGQALGYVHQVQWGLVELIQRSRKSPTTLLRLETLDDIETSEPNADSLELTQVKHQVTPASDLSENSVDLWRSLNVWMDVLAGGTTAMTPVLKLVTTASIPANSTLNHLRADGSVRDISQAVAGLENAARQSQNATTQPWRQKFLNMSASERSSFVSLITIDDSSPRARDVGETLKEVLRYAPPHGHEDTFIQYLLGWWYQICIRLLDRTLDAVTADDLDLTISDLRDQFLPDNLPTAPEVLVPFTQADSIPYRDRQFVQQLMWVALDEERLWRAIRDYHRAWTQRSEWLRLNLISEPELDRFAFRLYDEWEYIFQQRVAKMHRERGPAEDVTGQEILELVSAESRARVRERFDESWLNRGTLHALADGWSNRTIGWHPDFAIKLTELLAGVTR